MKRYQLIPATSALALLLGFSLGAHGQEEQSEGYVYDSINEAVRDGSGDCVRTPLWDPSLATLECDPDLVKKPEPVARVEPQPAPPPAPPQPTFEKITLEATTLFDFDQAMLRPEGRAKLDELVAELKQNPRVGTVRITGHTDSIGTLEYNQKLSERRAEAVREYLVEQGIDPTQTESQGLGETQPVADNETPEGRQQNRRVEIEVPVQRQVTC